MNISSEEMLMYSVMRAIYESGIPISFKGSMVLKACLVECGFKEETRHTVDIDVNRPMPPTKIYEIDGMQFRGVSPAQIIADKVYAISTDAVFRRPKDIVDLYYLSKVFRFEKEEMMHILTNSGRRLDGFQGFLQRTEDLKHSYGRFRFDGGVSKPSFEEVYSAVKSYIGDVLPREKKREICR